MTTIMQPQSSLAELPNASEEWTSSSDSRTLVSFPHSYRIKTFLTPTKCGICSKILLGLRKQGSQCTVCGLVVHHRCKEESKHRQSCAERAHKKLESEDSGRKESFPIRDMNAPEEIVDLKFLTNEVGDSSESSLLAHNLRDKTFTSPTKCDVCEKLLLGFANQGKVCTACGISVHGKCVGAANAKFPCDHVPKQVSGKSKRQPLLQKQIEQGSIHHISTGEKVNGNEDSTDFISGWANKFDQWTEQVKANFKDLDEDVSSWADRMGDRVSELDKVFDEKLNEYSTSTQQAIERIEQRGVQTSIVEQLKRGSDALANAINNLGEKVESDMDRGEEVHIDDEVMEKFTSVSEGMQTFGGACSNAVDFVRESTQKGFERLGQTDAVKEWMASTDPEVVAFRETLRDGLSSAGSIMNQVYDSIGVVGEATGNSVVRVTTHLYGKKAGRVARSSCEIAGHGYKSYANVTGILTGSALLRSTLQTAPGWTMREPCVFDGCMYASVYSSLELKATTPLQKIVRSCSEALSKEELVRLLGNVELAVAGQVNGGLEDAVVNEGPISISIRSEDSVVDDEKALTFEIKVSDCSKAANGVNSKVQQVEEVVDEVVEL